VNKLSNSYASKFTTRAIFQKDFMTPQLLTHSPPDF